MKEKSNKHEKSESKSKEKKEKSMKSESEYASKAPVCKECGKTQYKCNC
jgi:hypothetical protein